MTSYQDLLRQGIAELNAAGIEGAARDAHVLMAYCLKIDRSRLTLILRDEADYFTLHEFMVLIRERARRSPVSAIVGYKEFFGRRFVVNEDVLDPRPETECLVALALEQPFSQVLDLGTGSGCILLTLLAERADATGVGIDWSERALAVARKNAALLGLEDRIWPTRGNWFAGVGGEFDLIVSNPPYIAVDEMEGLMPEVRDHDPRVALTDEGDGLGAYRVIAAGVCEHLRPGGRVLVEIGPTQGAAVVALFETAGLETVQIYTDLDGRDRVVAAKKRLSGDNRANLAVK